MTNFCRTLKFTLAKFSQGAAEMAAAVAQRTVHLLRHAANRPKTLRARLVTWCASKTGDAARLLASPSATRRAPQNRTYLLDELI